MAVEHLVSRVRRYSLWIWTVVVLAITVGLAARVGFSIDDLSFLAIPVVFTTLGAIIATRVPGNRIAWLFLGIGGGSTIEPIAQLRLHATPTDPNLIDVLAIAAANSSFFIFFLIPVPVLLFLFPDGQFMNRRWSWAAWLSWLMVADILFVTLFAKRIGTENSGWTVDNPIGFHNFSFAEEDQLNPLIAFFGVGLFALLVGGVVAMVARYRRSDVVTRTQIKWILYATVFWSVSWVFRLVTDDRGFVSDLTTGTATLLIPVSIVVAITKYRLFDIDRLVSRTVGYAIVIGVLAVTFAGLIALPGLLIGSAEESPLVVAASTLAVAALFNPVRKRVIRWIDRRFNRSRYDAEQVVAGFGDRLQDEVDLDRVTNDSIDVVVGAMQPETIGLWVKE